MLMEASFSFCAANGGNFRIAFDPPRALLEALRSDANWRQGLSQP